MKAHSFFHFQTLPPIIAKGYVDPVSVYRPLEVDDGDDLEVSDVCQWLARDRLFSKLGIILSKAYQGFRLEGSMDELVMRILARGKILDSAERARDQSNTTYVGQIRTYALRREKWLASLLKAVVLDDCCGFARVGWSRGRFWSTSRRRCRGELLGRFRLAYPESRASKVIQHY